MTCYSLDSTTCMRARLARDHRFDGRFFTGVLSTGIFCRPICPAPQPLEKHVRYFPTASAALQAGLRPCLRCRPESAPGSAAWSGTAAVVNRCLNLIQAGYLQHHSTEQLAQRVGLGTRHLRRLCQQHLGSTAQTLEQHRRVLLAKKLLHETHLRLADIAFHAGFASVRQFNHSFKRIVGCPPSNIRRQSTSKHRCVSTHQRATGSHHPDPLQKLTCAYRPPFDWQPFLDYLRPRLIPGVEWFEGTLYSRTLRHGTEACLLQIGNDAAHRRLTISISATNVPPLATLLQSVQRQFDCNSNLEVINAQLRQDPLLNAVPVTSMRLPGSIDPFEILVRAIVGQQISVKAASTLMGRLVAQCSTPIHSTTANGESRYLFPTPPELARADFSRIGLTRRQQQTLHHAAQALLEGRLIFPAETELGAGLSGDESQRIREQLLAIHGIGPWTADYVLMRGFSDPDAFPAADLGLMKASGMNANQLGRRALQWRPWRAYAAIMLWQSFTAKVTPADG